MSAEKQIIRGSFHVELPPLAPGEAMTGLPFGRRALAKTFEGPLTGTSKGEMISWMTATKGSAGYVAIEQVTGTIEGRSGTFALQHSSTMRRGEPFQSIVVVPDSGTDGLAGLTGAMRIIIAPGGAHEYEFEYSFEAAATS
jgi:hypothetical protein